jgi:hypothetical protein
MGIEAFSPKGKKKRLIRKASSICGDLIEGAVWAQECRFRDEGGEL